MYSMRNISRYFVKRGQFFGVELSRNRKQKLTGPSAASSGFMAAVLTVLILPVLAQPEEVFRYTLQTEDDRRFEYVFEASAQPASQPINREQAIVIATEWITTFHHLHLGSIENAEFREKPLPHWLICFADTASGPVQHLVFAVVLPDGRIVQPKVSERL
jgi:hypothetical protein